jgi:hypothetical protein
MDIIYILIWVLFVHFLSDFVFQSDWMARNKSKDVVPLFVHSSTYGIVMGLCLWLFGLGLPFHLVLAYCVINSCAHFWVDFVTSKLNSKLWTAKKVHWFFVSVGFDWYLHTTILLLSLKLLID